MKRAFEIGYGVYALFVAGIMMVPGTLLIILTPGLANRRRVARFLARVLLRLAGARPSVSGLDKLPESACVVVANHASYVDGIVIKAALPPRFSFVIKREARYLPLGGFMLSRLGSEFVNRTDGHAGARDARRILRKAADGQALGFFPEGTFNPEPGLNRFRLGAFITAARAELPVVPMVIHGTRQMLPSGAWLPRPSKITVQLLEPLLPAGNERDAARVLRQRARDRILAHLAEPDLNPGQQDRLVETPRTN